MNTNTETIGIEVIGKKEALEILQRNTINRPISRANVEFIKSEMMGGSFKVNGSTIVISSDGVLLDGQHRLQAISELEITIPAIVVRGVSDTVFSTIDTGKSRSHRDVFNSKKVKYANEVSVACRKILDEFQSKREYVQNSKVKLSNTDVFEFYYKNKDELDNMAEFCAHLYTTETKTVVMSTAIAMLFLLSKEDRQKARSFIRELYTGTKENISDAALILRKRLINHKIDGYKVDEANMRALFIIAFRAYKSDRTISKLQVSSALPTYVFKQD